MPSHPNGGIEIRGRRGGLSSADIRLIEHVCHFSQRHSDLSLVRDVFELPAIARRELLALLGRLVEVDEHRPDLEATFRVLSSIGDELHAWARKHGRGRRLADAFIMRHETWRAVHTIEALSWGCSEP
jgi:hypothetical protein